MMEVLGLFVNIAMLAVVMFVSIFKKHWVMNLAIFFLSIGVMWMAFEVDIGGYDYFYVAMIFICGWQLVEIAKMRKGK